MGAESRRNRRVPEKTEESFFSSNLFLPFQRGDVRDRSFDNASDSSSSACDAGETFCRTGRNWLAISFGNFCLPASKGLAPTSRHLTFPLTDHGRETQHHQGMSDFMQDRCPPSPRRIL